MQGFRFCIARLLVRRHSGSDDGDFCMLQLDHIAIAADSLAAGVAYAEAALGVKIPYGGAHPLMGTHNHLLRLGDNVFLEIIAPDPAAGPLTRRRWFALDDAVVRADL